MFNDGETQVRVATFDFERITDAEEWAQRQSLIFDTDDECRAEAERLLEECSIRERDEQHLI